MLAIILNERLLLRCFWHANAVGKQIAPSLLPTALHEFMTAW